MMPKQSPTRPQEVARLESEALALLQSGREAASIAAWKRLLELDPTHVRALTLVGQYAFRQADFTAARAAFERITRVDGSEVRQWTQLAFACQRLHDDAAEEEALAQAARTDPGDLLMLLLRGQLFERLQRSRAAAAAYGGAVAVAPPFEQLAPEMRPLLLHAIEFRQRHLQDLGAVIDAGLEQAFRECSGENLDRFRLSIDIMVGRRRRYDSQPIQYFYPGLAPIEFFDRALFPWLPELEARTEAVREELLNVLEADIGLTPYIDYPEDRPLAQWAALNKSLDWSAYHLVRSGEPVAGHAERCPRTMAAWRLVPAPDQPGRTPNLMFSVLRPHTRIPPHVGSSNVRMVGHLPLVVPPGCGFRVGNTIRQWQEGVAWIFDDTIEHEAWNDSDHRRAILIFDTWHPQLSAAERRMITELGRCLNRLPGDDAESAAP